jgi:hypothetical protein
VLEIEGRSNLYYYHQVDHGSEILIKNSRRYFAEIEGR